jgi:hypothetical protein
LDDDEKRRSRNCCGEFGTMFGVAWDDRVDMCPRSYLTEEVDRMIGWYNDWKRFGALPFDGDVLDQPLYVYEALNVCVAACEKAEAELMGRRRLEMDRG